MHDGTELGGHLKRLQRARDHAPDEVDAELSQEVLLAVGAALDELPLPKHKIRKTDCATTKDTRAERRARAGRGHRAC